MPTHKMKAGSLPGAITVEDILYEQKQKLQLQTNYVRFETQKPAFCDYLLRRIPCYLRMRITQPLAYGRTNPNNLIISTGIYLHGFIFTLSHTIALTFVHGKGVFIFVFIMCSVCTFYELISLNVLIV